MPTGEPQAEWDGIPIMPDALAGEDRGDAYAFTVEKSREDVKSYYQTELGSSGWTLFAEGQGDDGTLSLLIFQKGSELLTIGFVDVDESVLMVLLLKS